MDLYLSESGALWQGYMYPCNQDSQGDMKSNIFTGSKLLQSFYYCNNFTEDVILPSVSKFMLDSGAFTFFQSGKQVNWNDYVERYAEFINRNRIKLFLELDIDVLIGYENVKKLRKKLESLTGSLVFLSGINREVRLSLSRCAGTMTTWQSVG